MHPEADALLAAIFDSPDDDTARLVYADWLQENGQDDYAQFIRLSVQADGGSKPPAESKRLRSDRKPFWHRMAAVRHDILHHGPVSIHDLHRRRGPRRHLPAHGRIVVAGDHAARPDRVRDAWVRDARHRNRNRRGGRRTSAVAAAAPVLLSSGYGCA